MKLFLLQRRDRLGNPFGVIVRARSNQEARTIASERALSKGSKSAWLNSATCEELVPEGPVGLVVTDDDDLDAEGFEAVP